MGDEASKGGEAVFNHLKGRGRVLVAAQVADGPSDVAQECVLAKRKLIKMNHKVQYYIAEAAFKRTAAFH